MSTEPTPENLANALRRWAEVEQGYPLHSRTGVELAAKAADLIEAQQARIEELEAALADLCMHQLDAWRLDGLLDDYRSLLPAYRAASPDTPETRP